MKVAHIGYRPSPQAKKRYKKKVLYLFLCSATDGVFTDLGIGKKKLNRDDWRPAHLQYEGYYQAGQHQGV